MPILKQLVSNTSQSKRRSRADLTAGMISAPLGDFRHTMHVGRGGDEFGDTSFLSTRSGEPPRQTEDQPPCPQQTSHPPSSKPGFLSRTFRHSKRSSSVTRVDKRESTLAPASGSPAFVKAAVSLPYLNDDTEAGQGGGSLSSVRKSLSSSPLKKLPSYEKPVNGAAASKPCEQEIQDERDFGELTDLPPASLSRTGGGMKHAESIMSFHIDLGPSMLGDILSVMDNKAWEEDDLGFEEGKSSEGRGSPAPATLEQLPAKPAMVSESENHTAPFSPEARLRLPRQHLDSCSVSSSGSAALEEKPPTGEFQVQGETDSAKFSSPRGEEDKDLSFMDEDDDEITV
ncbi:Cdc42 effector protein 4 [Acipenser ruthenus]|uniref:Cdc42 effector protein 4 n=1 Tax=Acipenser ruthenus TaxID=7906 RepID=A0A444UQD5_ACIRT|nr:Cdc42 effector protein 4 [Acipenser ruthenus]